MDTGAVKKSTASTVWTTEKLQEQISDALIGHMMVAIRLLETSPDVIAELQREWAQLKVKNFRAQGVKTPIDLVRVWTDYETNMFGSKMRFWGDEKQAHVEYQQCGCWDALERMSTSETNKQAMCGCWEEITRALAEEFGFTGEEKIGTGPDEAYCTITFTKNL